MKKFLPLIFTAVAFIVFSAIIFKHERHITKGDDIYIKLAPTDPRSLIQGDYMALTYEFHWAMPDGAELDWFMTSPTNMDEPPTPPDMPWKQPEDYFDARRHHYEGKPHIAIWVVLDNQHKVVKSAFDKNELTPSEQASARQLVIKNPHNHHSAFYAAASSFMFAEGLASCYANARYAHQKTDEQGSPILVDLVGDDLQPLYCEKQAKQRTS